MPLRDAGFLEGDVGIREANRAQTGQLFDCPRAIRVAALFPLCAEHRAISRYALPAKKPGNAAGRSRSIPRWARQHASDAGTPSFTNTLAPGPSIRRRRTTAPLRR